MKAIIFAAGRGTRLEPSANSPKPKILLEIGGRSLLEWHCLRLSSVGVTTIVIVIGYQQAAIQEAVSRLNDQFACDLTTIFNPQYKEGSVLSFAAGLPAMTDPDEPVLLMDGDVLYPGTMLRRLIDSPVDTCLLIDRSINVTDPEPVQVPVRHGRPVDFLKAWQGQADHVGESIGFFKIGVGDQGWLMAETTRLGVQRPAAPYEDVIRAMVQNGRFDCEDVTGIPWIEIDFPADLKRARERVLPAILHHEMMNAWLEHGGSEPDMAELRLEHENLLKLGCLPIRPVYVATGQDEPQAP